MKLLSDRELERSWTVANSAMNRNRGLVGTNSYTKELGFCPLDFLRQRLATRGEAAWLDLCCGNGRALREATAELAQYQHVDLVGVDLVATWPGSTHDQTLIRFEAASIHDWRPNRLFDLITCVHGVHYLGDKLRLIERSIAWLAPGGRFAAHLDLANLRFSDGRAMNRAVLKQFRELGLTFDRRRRLLICDGARSLKFGYTYLGADDDAGPNFTGQRAVNSYYEGPR